MNTKKVNVQMLEPQPTNDLRTIGTMSSQTIAKPNVICSVSHVYGECRGWSCPICDKISQKVGDVNNPSVIIYGEKMCADCKIKIKELIDK